MPVGASIKSERNLKITTPKPWIPDPVRLAAEKAAAKAKAKQSNQEELAKLPEKHQISSFPNSHAGAMSANKLRQDNGRPVLFLTDYGDRRMFFITLSTPKSGGAYLYEGFLAKSCNCSSGEVPCNGGCYKRVVVHISYNNPAKSYWQDYIE